MECYEKYYEIFIETNEEKGIKVNNWKKKIQNCEKLRPDAWRRYNL